MSREQLDALYRLATKDRVAFPDAIAAWNFVGYAVFFAVHVFEAMELNGRMQAQSRNLHRRPGRKSKDLQDFVIYQIRHSYPSRGRPGAAWDMAFAATRLVWPHALLTENIKRDMRRRRDDLFAVPSHEFIALWVALPATGLPAPMSDLVEWWRSELKAISPPPQNSGER